MLFAYFTAAAVASAPPSLEAIAGTVNFENASNCVTEAANRSSFDRLHITPIPDEVIEECAPQLDAAAENVAKALSDFDPDSVRTYLTTKVRLVAMERLISRLEDGEEVRSFVDPGLGHEKDAARYINCIQLTMLYKGYGTLNEGGTWPPDTVGASYQKIEDYLVMTAQSSCPKSREKYSKSLERVLETNDNILRKKIAERMSVRSIENLAVKQFVQIAVEIQQRKQ